MDRGHIDQGSGNRSGTRSGDMTGSLNYGQPNWDVPKNLLEREVANLDSFVIVGIKDGKSFIASTDSEVQAKQLFRENAPRDLIPQTA